MSGKQFAWQGKGAWGIAAPAPLGAAWQGCTPNHKGNTERACCAPRSTGCDGPACTTHGGGCSGPAGRRTGGAIGRVGVLQGMGEAMGAKGEWVLGASPQQRAQGSEGAPRLLAEHGTASGDAGAWEKNQIWYTHPALVRARVLGGRPGSRPWLALAGLRGSHAHADLALLLRQARHGVQRLAVRLLYRQRAGGTLVHRPAATQTGRQAGRERRVHSGQCTRWERGL